MCEHCDINENTPESDKWAISYWHLDDECGVCVDGPHRLNGSNSHAILHYVVGDMVGSLIQSGMLLTPCTPDEDAYDLNNPDGGYATFLATMSFPPMPQDPQWQGEDPDIPPIGEPVLLVVAHQQRRDITNHLRTLYERSMTKEMDTLL